MTNYWERFSRAVDRFGERPAIVVQHSDGTEQWSYRTLRDEAEAFAQRLADAGVSSGDRCAILSQNSPAWCAAYLAILRLGAIAVPLDRTNTPAQIEALLTDSGASVLLASRLCWPAAEAARDRTVGRPRLIALDPPGPHTGTSTLPETRNARCRASRDDPAVILYTSGTTSDPKGVVLTHGNLLAAVDGMLAALPLSEQDCTLGALPFFHILSQISGILLPFAEGGAVVLLREVNAGEVLRAMRERHITVLCSVPQFFYLIHERITQEIAKRGPPQRALVRLLQFVTTTLRRFAGINVGRLLFRRIHTACGPQVRFFVSAGAPFDEDIARSLHAFGFDLLQAYGLTESTGAATITPPGRQRIGTVGLPLAGVSVAVLTPEGSTCAPGQEGEIALRGATLTPGYYRRPDVTAAAFRDGWFWTGDLGRMESGGQVRITGRRKDVIVLSSGKNVYPEEVERHLERSRFVKEVCVVGRQHPGRARSENLYAAVVPDMAVLRQHQVVNIREHLRNEIETLSAQLPPHKRIMGFVLLREDLPRTTTRKIKRFAVHQVLAQQGSDPERTAGTAREWTAEDNAMAATPVASIVLATIQREAPARPAAVHPDDSLELDLGFDSLARVELIATLEQALGARLGESAATRCYTVGELIAAAQHTRDGENGTFSANAGLVWAGILNGHDGPVPGPNGEHLQGTGAVLDALRFGGLMSAHALARLLLRLDVEGLEHLPASGPFILCANHQSYLDGPLILSSVPYSLVRRTVLLGKTRIFQRPIVHALASRYNIAVVDADANLVRAMRISARVLREGRVLMLFPEGERTIDGGIKPLRRGAAILACHLGLPILPVIIDGAYEIWPRGRGIQRLRPIALRFRPPLAAPSLASGPDMPSLEERAVALTKALQHEMETTLAVLRSRRPGHDTAMAADAG